jgi:predicted tellurium resistance membrane protein TerC
VRPSFAAVITQIAVLDIVFSLDSVITAVGMADEITIMVTAVILAVGVMMLSAKPIIYFAMGFSVFVEVINLRVRRVAVPVHLHEPYV